MYVCIYTCIYVFCRCVYTQAQRQVWHRDKICNRLLQGLIGRYPTKKKERKKRKNCSETSEESISISTCFQKMNPEVPPPLIKLALLTLVCLQLTCFLPAESVQNLLCAPYSEISPLLVLLWMLLITTGCQTAPHPSLKEILLRYFYTSFPSLHFLSTSFCSLVSD